METRGSAFLALNRDSTTLLAGLSASGSRRSETMERRSLLVASTLTFLSIAEAIAVAPWTTKCSPEIMTFPGASATPFRGAHRRAWRHLSGARK
jgi:hypothetical protein